MGSILNWASPTCQMRLYTKVRKKNWCNGDYFAIKKKRTLNSQVPSPYSCERDVKLYKNQPYSFSKFHIIAELLGYVLL